MIPGLSIEIADSTERLLVRAMQGALFAVFAYGLLTVQLGMAIGAGISLGVTLLPAVLRREYDYSMKPSLVLWLTLAVFLHSLGSLGPYLWFSWYDNITHTVSSVVIASVGYVTLRAFEEHSDDIDVPGEFRGVFIVVFVLSVGVVWELVEFGSEGLADILGVQAPLIVMGIDDIVTDMIFNAVGAVILAVFGTGRLSRMVSFVRQVIWT